MKLTGGTVIEEKRQEEEERPEDKARPTAYGHTGGE